ncbi:MAG TPA: MaoC family dehydratase N-terminal domain-containing protein [Rubrobacteraceae bacterium]|nr:MaoC family dehydratase N-terminal domain-containing protein [Rubrobacteraceae bacterium]
MLYEEFLGKRSEPVKNLIERGAVRKFAEAIADPNPLYVDEAAARAGRHGRLLAPPTFPRTFDYGRIVGLELPVAGMIHGEFRIFYERPLFVWDEVMCGMELKDSYDKQSRRGLLGFLIFERTGESLDGDLIFTMDDIVVVTETVRKVILA